ncbi:MAG TPA: thioredoxin family protein, partial [Bacteroidia bacterium]|nr:thioredoxin family protein [Bacteroidia bacterium]
EALNRGKIRLLLMLRDENPEIMDAYLTNGSRSIPKLIALADKTREELFTWGPRPAPVQQIMLNWRAAGSPEEVDYKKDIQYWYLRDNGQELQKELVELMKGG